MEKILTDLKDDCIARTDSETLATEAFQEKKAKAEDAIKVVSKLVSKLSASEIADAVGSIFGKKFSAKDLKELGGAIGDLQALAPAQVAVVEEPAVADFAPEA